MIIGVTGSFGTGKTTVAKMMAKKGAKVLDADKLSHVALKIGSNTYKRIVSAFGKDLLNRNKSINKAKLAKVVFGNRKKLKKLSNIIHPFVIKKIRIFIKKIDPEKVVVIDAPLLLEAGLGSIVDKLIVVRANRKKQLLRCMKKTNLKKEEVMARIKNQIALSKKICMADYVIDNNGTLRETKEQVDKIWREIKWI